MRDLEARARESAEEARVLFDNLLFSGACSRAYYAMFNMARSMLIHRGYPLERVKTHRTVLRLFSEEFVRDGSFDVGLARGLRRAADARHVADYAGGVTREEAEQVMRTLDAFIDRATALLSQPRE
jgi:uncharacterized protein (UPF0332 family)